jgi:chemotaxis protein CheD
MSEVVLHPGDFYFTRAGEHRTVVRTLLGSCVAVTLWHPRLGLGGMCHFVVPKRGDADRADGRLDGRYAEDAVRMFGHAVDRNGTRPEEYEVGLFGGGSQFPAQRGGTFDVPGQNVAAARRLLERAGFRVGAEHVGGTGPRVVELDLETGTIRLRHNEHRVGRGM